jgi:hypothetical protein
VGDGRVDGVFGDVAADAQIVVVAGFLGQAPRWRFILSAVCQVRMITSPTRPMAWLSDAMIENAPISCRMSSAAIVSLRMRLSAKAMSSGMRAVEVVADHQHVEMLGHGVHRVGPRRVGGGRQDVGARRP